ncbi:integral membrane protein [Streptomyces zinciresistens K42]|uniref:Integral membrane protein n=1 Tax=Streptomyces zinciresistens K42 TaxID=700597 RepID=G2GBJ3_9ACTN|nr:DUF3099 domain-containing protein [Streptomyces zinciresistens]EGX59109.1 integral membrane protein [Streptomyces zinciresistens K42]
MTRKLHTGGKSPEVFRITGARTGLQEDVRGRQRRYVISMSIRTLSVVLAAVLWDVQRYVAVVGLVLGVILPYLAVVIANAGRESIRSLPSTFTVAPLRTMIAPPRSDGDFEASEREESAAPPGSGAHGEPRDPV